MDARKLINKLQYIENRGVIADEQVKHLPQALLIKGGFGWIVNIKGVTKQLLRESLWTHKTKKDEQLSLLVLKTLCHDVLDHRTFIDDYFKILDFIEWLKEFYPEKAKFLTNKS